MSLSDYSYLAPKTAIILVNLGTPDAPTVPAVRRYLRQFLSDTRVIEIPKLAWAIILNLFVLPFRPKRVSHAYASIWQGDSPMRLILNEQVGSLEQKLISEHTIMLEEVRVFGAMTYGQPALSDILSHVRQADFEKIIVLPLYPQYSATTTGAVFDVIADWGKAERNLPQLHFIKDYYNHPLYIKALADSVRTYQAQYGKPDKLLMSFHGIPLPYEQKGDPYAQRCRITAQLLANELGLVEKDWLCSFQSRFGKQEWVKPYTSQVLQEWGEQGVQSVQVMSPSFSADCLETLEELAVENRDIFLNAGTQAGNKTYHYIPALNSDDGHIRMMASLLQRYIN